jgi:hypothetical protein
VLLNLPGSACPRGRLAPGGSAIAGYSGTPLAKKLGIKAGHDVALVNAPPDFADLLAPLPEEVTLHADPRGRSRFDIILFFTRDWAALAGQFPRLANRLTPAGGLWVAWPKRASGVATDLTEDRVRAVGLDVGLVDNKVCAVDDTWSGLRFVFRLVDRPKKNPSG